MPKFTTPTGSTQRYISALDRAQGDSVPGTKKVYADRAAFLQGLADERACIAMGLPVWYDGIDLQVLAEPAAVKRLWTLSTTAGSAAANAAASHGRTAVIAFKKFTLASDDNRVHASTGAPASGMGDNGDLCLDETAGVVYLKTGGAWGQVASLGGGAATPIVDDLTTGGSTAALSAEQGKTLKTLADGKADAFGAPMVVGFVGDSLTSFTEVNTPPLVARDIRGYGSHLIAVAGGAILPGKVLGMSGDITANIVAAMDAWLPTLTTERTIVLYTGTNDLVAGALTAQQLFDQIMSGVGKIKATGRAAIVGLLMPNTSAVTAPKIALRLAVNKLLRDARDQGLVTLVEWDDVPQQASGTIPVSILYDGVHPAPNGAERMGLRLYDVMRPALVPVSPASWAPVGAASPRIVNGVMAGTAGSVAGGASGVVADGWLASNGGTGSTAVCSKVASTDSDPTDWQQVVCTAGSATQYFEFQRQIAGGAGSFAVCAIIEVEVPDDASVLSFHLRTKSWAGTQPGRNHLQENDATKLYTAGTRRRFLRIPAMTVDATEAANMTVYISIEVAAGKTAALRVRRVGSVEV
ncbi:SGNH/GDSL hydrolase family protein [Pseudorhodoferax soli]|uniref:Lysophospholipase L1-like esterase n=1 Tax=Pseudorhodoferax soli TaxID=545864 RepID=A0A368Y6H3_9BURK|nr:hypothetical protein [Pseudorhodoferax soli]RCW73804.1 lysophospholipase L1-like esterase [Pseudorhodoferax soli]